MNNIYKNQLHKLKNLDKREAVLNNEETIKLLKENIKNMPITFKCKFTALYCEHDKSGITSYLKCFHTGTNQEDRTNCYKNNIKCNWFESKSKDSI